MSFEQRIATSTDGGMWRVGDVVEDLYEVRQVMTSGGMGVVYRVHHNGWNMDLAVKTPRPELVSSPQRITDFETEAETWVGLGLHPHIVACVYVRRLDGLPRVFAEWVDGGSLTEAIESGRLYKGTGDEVLARILDAAIQFAWGLDYAHSRGLVHQDVKPLNVMCTADWTVKVTDFGLAKARTAAGEPAAAAPGGSVLAGYGGGFTPAYCSPEQAQAAHTAQTGGRPAALTRATDVWSWAISVWEMFTGERPCRQGQAAAEAFEAFSEDNSVDDPAIPAMPEDVTDLLARCLDPDPATRPRRIGELADELAELYLRLVGAPYPRTKPERAELVADGLNNQALSMLDLGRVDEAEQLWQHALVADAHHVDAVFNYGLHRWRTGQITDTDLIAWLEAARASHPGPQIDYLLGAVQLERHDIPTARELLTAAARAAPEDRQIAEAAGAADRLTMLTTRTLTGHTESVASVAVSADGRIAVSAGNDETVRVWDVGSGACVRILTGHTESVASVAVSADGRIAVSAGNDETVRVWDVGSGSCLRTLTGHTGWVLSVAVSADGRIAVSAGWDSTVRVWDLDSGACRHTLSGHTPTDEQVLSVAVSADARIAVSAGWDRTVRVWDLGSGACLRTLTGRAGYVSSVAVSADGRIAVSGGDDQTVRVWEVPSTRVHLAGFSYSHPHSADDVLTSAAVVNLAMQRAETLLAAGDGAAAAEQLRTARAVPGYRRYPGLVELWRRLAGVGARGPLQDSWLRHTLAGHSDVVRSVAVSADGRVAVSAGDDGIVRVWDLASGACLHILTGHTPTDEQVLSVAVSADGRIAVSGSSDETVRVWDLGGGTCVHTLTGHIRGVGSVAVSADGRIAVSGSFRETVRVWDLASAACLHILTDEHVMSVAVSADARIAVSGGVDGIVRVWDLASGACLHTLTGHTNWVTSVAVSADARTAVSAGVDGIVRVWDLASGACLRTLAGHIEGVVLSVAVSADARTAVSAGNDGIVRVWDLASGACLHTLTGHTNWLNSVAVSGDAHIAVSTEHKTVWMWVLDWEYEFGAGDSSGSAAPATGLDRRG